jgi:hypothetical protein
MKRAEKTRTYRETRGLNRTFRWESRTPAQNEADYGDSAGALFLLRIMLRGVRE